MLIAQFGTHITEVEKTPSHWKILLRSLVYLSIMNLDGQSDRPVMEYL